MCKGAKYLFPGCLTPRRCSSDVGPHAPGVCPLSPAAFPRGIPPESPLAVAARLFVLGQVPVSGLLSPEVLEPRPFLEALERWGVRLQVRRETTTERFY